MNYGIASTLCSHRGWAATYPSYTTEWMVHDDTMQRHLQEMTTFYNRYSRVIFGRDDFVEDDEGIHPIQGAGGAQNMRDARSSIESAMECTTLDARLETGASIIPPTLDKNIKKAHVYTIHRLNFIERSIYGSRASMYLRCLLDNRCSTTMPYIWLPGSTKASKLVVACKYVNKVLVNPPYITFDRMSENPSRVATHHTETGI